MKNLILIYLIFGCLLACVMIFVTGCPPCHASSTDATDATKGIRFVKIGYELIEHDGESIKAIIYEDKKTGFHYIYFWGGRANGGPTFSRLWEEKADKEK